MGRKYGSIHIRLENLNGSVDAVISGYVNALNVSIPINVGKFAEQLGLDISRQQLPFLNKIVRTGMLTPTKQTVIKHQGFVSIYDERMTFENVQTVAQSLSTTLCCQVFFSSVYDDDVFFFGLCENGETVSLHLSGNCEVYGMTNENHNIEKMVKYISREETDTSRLQNLSASDFEAALIEVLGFQLDIKPRKIE